ncbi:GlsB/YeaQ/YmgE family stress response membrane protein [Burkholderia latens]|nr:GlsB/YeaQ/YmgE family stress response membrane protein [Burkholderia latens]
MSTQHKEKITMTHGLIMWLIIGAIAGWLAGLLVKGGGFGLIVDIIVGIVGAVIGGWLAGLLGISIGSGFIGSVIVAVIGAVILLFVIRLFRRAA